MSVGSKIAQRKKRPNAMGGRIWFFLVLACAGLMAVSGCSGAGGRHLPFGVSGRFFAIERPDGLPSGFGIGIYGPRRQVGAGVDLTVELKPEAQPIPSGK